MNIIPVDAPGFVVACTARTDVFAVGGVVVKTVVVGLVVGATVVFVSVRITAKLDMT